MSHETLPAVRACPRREALHISRPYAWSTEAAGSAASYSHQLDQQNTHARAHALARAYTHLATCLLGWSSSKCALVPRPALSSTIPKQCRGAKCFCAAGKPPLSAAEYPPSHGLCQQNRPCAAVCGCCCASCGCNGVPRRYRQCGHVAQGSYIYTIASSPTPTTTRARVPQRSSTSSWLWQPALPSCRAQRPHPQQRPQPGQTTCPPRSTPARARGA
jgi:hypothetical protein